MWPFNKKVSKPDHLPIDGPWSLGEGKNDGKIMIVRSNTGYREFGSIPGYEYQIGIAIPLRSPQPTGLPTPEENIELRAIEDKIRASLEEKAESLFVTTITTSGMKELVFYTSSPEQAKRRFEQLRSQIVSHKIQLMIKADKEWNTYRQLLT